LKSGSCNEALQFVGKARLWPEGLGAGQPFPSEIDDRLADWLSYQCHLKSNSSAEAQKDLERILSFRSRANNRDVGQIIHALALKQSGRASEAEALLKDWLKEDPSSELAKWGLEVVSGNKASSPSPQDGSCQILSASL
jgi:predicted Zn-dependent protease